MAEFKVKGVFLAENQKTGERKIEVKLTNGTKIIIEACHESWEQYGGTVEELRLTVPIAKEYNDWLHGGDLVKDSL